MTCAAKRVVGETWTARTRTVVVVARQASAFCCFVYLVLLVTLFDLGLAISGDGLHLLEFKKKITHDQCSVLSDWNEEDHHPCNWRGVTCDISSQRVVGLNIDGRQAGRETRNWSSSRPRPSVSKPSSNRVKTYTFDSSLVTTQGEVGDTPRCSLSGTLSPALGKLSKLRTLSITHNNITGVIPGELAELELLQTLDLRSNSLRGQLPGDFGRLRHLQVLNLDNNALEGSIPDELSLCENLRTLSLSGNELQGTVSPSLGRLQKLEWLALASNQLVGTLPLELTNSWCKLKFSGSIPSELGQLWRLSYLDVAFNALSGPIPPELAECHQLEVLVLSSRNACVSVGNDLRGCTLRGKVGIGEGENNRFEGPLPSTLGSLPRLRVLWAPNAGLVGPFPRYGGACSSLEVINLSQNALAGDLPGDLSNCSRLVYLDVSSNQLTGKFPSKVAVQCMVVFNVSRNMLSGELSEVSYHQCLEPQPWKGYFSPSIRSSLLRDSLISESFFSVSLVNSRPPANGGRPPRRHRVEIIHDWSFNRFTGWVPPSALGKGLKKRDALYLFSIAGNQLTGGLPPQMFEVCKEVGALALDVSDNMLSGSLPSTELVSCSTLVKFLAARNMLSGEIPQELSGLRNLAHLDLTGNYLRGRLPDKIGELESLKVLLLAQNKLSGSLPYVLGHAAGLQVLDLSQNEFSGSLPESLSFLKQLRKLCLNGNRFSGVVPAGLSNLSFIEDVNLSFNDFSGPVHHWRDVDSLCLRGSFAGNPKIEGCEKRNFMSKRLLYSPTGVNNITYMGVPQPSQVPQGLFEVQSKRLNSILIAAITSGCAIALVLLVLGILFQCTRQRSPTSHCATPGRKEVVTFMSVPCHMTYENVLRATGNFSIDNLIGNGGFGATYKAELRPGFLVAVKRLALGRFQGVQQFDTEIRTLGRIQHPNLVTLLGYHASHDEMFLIYNYFPRGNLDTLIHTSRREMDWRIRHNIALRIAEALAFLHDDCVPRVLHRDIKPSNILLDDNLNAHLSDFGLARLLGTSETHATTDVAGTFGYVAPEYAMTCRVTDKADVYSYGVVLLELLSNKRALGDPCFFEFGDSFNIVSWACLLIRRRRPHEVFPVWLWEQGPEAILLEVLDLAVQCTVDSLTVRPTMREVVNVLKRLQPLA
ncbi:hypothetical protein R1sor_021699 [Riccia sorocarpa]|uniref:non-specific serine/threonine protein kinase n=1 Tax=Riccia sorocarpa TaxID=122646 RepID=A0ABD3GII4_9MARC